ncbi:PREDICTED: BAG family molecular chaperone regulator 8, chloroplastic [Nelumbo nucifera]|uniref:BAG family molecular chaperone regulator 8, chloroplastic n=1 Tax=Nelumbo nucifera TaxID=4432 RepID=A0A1U7ZWK5_NELNU|nr:PREDICTED: BAG family molecular chaperone regulator 8, chloroplastic [Nelumbo nucifera]
MASHHHHHHYYQYQYQNSCQPNNNNNNSCCCSCSCLSSHQSSAQSSQSPPPTDPLVQAIVTQLLQSSQSHLATQHLKPQLRQHHQQHKKQQQQERLQNQQTQTLLSSLFRRIDALESSLNQLSVSPPPPPSNSLRDIAARTIQTHFRAFLARRSRTLRHLKQLALIKSELITLKSSISDDALLHPHVLSQKAMDLLRQLEAIQDGDPMIRDGKKSISRELVRFLEFVDGISLKRQQLSSKMTRHATSTEDGRESRTFISVRTDPFPRIKNTGSGFGTSRRDFAGDRRPFIEKLSDQIKEVQRPFENDEEAEVELEAFHHISDDEENPRNLNYGGILIKRHGLCSSKAKKSVSFAENENLSRVLISSEETNTDDDQRELVEGLSREVEEIGGFSRVSEDDEEGSHTGSEGSSQVSDGDRNPRKNIKTVINYGIEGEVQGQDGNFMFSAPVPVQMEPIRTDVMKQKRILRAVSYS